MHNQRLSHALTLESKTLREWREEIRQQAHKFRNKYERCFSNSVVSLDEMRFYRQASDTYLNILDVLEHLVKYGKVIDTVNCIQCKFTTAAFHKDKLERDYEKYKKIISRCRDGEKYVGKLT